MNWIEHIVVSIIINLFIYRFVYSYKHATIKLLKHTIFGSICPDIPMIITTICIMKEPWKDSKEWIDIVHTSSLSYIVIILSYRIPHSLLFYIHLARNYKKNHEFLISYSTHLIADMISHKGIWSMQLLYPISTLRIEGFYDTWCYTHT